VELDGSENALKAVCFAGTLFSGKDEKKAIEGVVNKWISNQTSELV
jgi:hypothetical protein